MKKVLNQALVTVVTCGVVLTVTGCTNWKQEYKNLEIVYQNCQGRLQDCMSKLDSAVDERTQLGRQLSMSQKTIADLEKKLKSGKSEGEASGFGKDANVKYDPAAGTITVTLQNKVLFAPGKAALIRATSSELDHINNVIRDRYRGMQIDVVGHTDSDPIKKSKWKDNWQLSAERALTVLRYLNKKGIASEKIRAVASGSSRPVASNSSASGKAQNRRVEIVVHTR